MKIPVKTGFFLLLLSSLGFFVPKHVVANNIVSPDSVPKPSILWFVEPNRIRKAWSGFYFHADAGIAHRALSSRFTFRPSIGLECISAKSIGLYLNCSFYIFKAQDFRYAYSKYDRNNPVDSLEVMYRKNDPQRYFSFSPGVRVSLFNTYKVRWSIATGPEFGIVMFNEAPFDPVRRVPISKTSVLAIRLNMFSDVDLRLSEHLQARVALGYTENHRIENTDFEVLAFALLSIGLNYKF